MNIAVLAANGRSGRVFVERALKAGHSIRAGVFSQNSLVARPGLVVVQCDATKPDDVTALIAGQDAVVSFIGHVKNSPPRVQRDAMKVLVAAMGKANMSRVVSLTGTGARFLNDTIGPVDRFLNVGVAFADPNRIKDGIEHVEVLKQSSLEWTIIRVLKLQNFANRPFVLKAHGPTRWFVNRDEVASAVLEVLEHHEFIREAPILSKAK